MNRILKAVWTGCLALTLVSLSAPPAKAVVITVDSAQYDVTAISGTYASLESTLQGQVWWGSQTLADSFANAVGVQLGLPQGVGGPFFAYAADGTLVNAMNWIAPLNATVPVIVAAGDNPVTWAVANPIGNVPDRGTTSVMLVLALGGLIAVRRRVA